nr:hypothetical protein [Tanacetum cinerariifolium]
MKKIEYKKFDEEESLLGLILYRTPWPIKGVLRIQQYLQNEHYALWKVIEFGDSYKAPPEETGKGLTSESSAKKKGRTAAINTEDMQKRRNDVKARTTLFLALPDEHQLRFNKYETAKELWETILKTLGENEATKNTKTNQLKLQYGNFKAKGSETLEQTFKKLQAIMSHLEFMDVEIEQDDLNQMFLTSLAPEWLMYTIVWRNRDDLDTMSMDDVYNHLKVYEPEVQKKSESNSQNMAFISSSNTSSGKGEVHTTSVTTASTQVSTASTDVAAASLSHDTICSIMSKPMIKFVKEADCPRVIQINNTENARKLTMKYDEMYKNISKVSRPNMNVAQPKMTSFAKTAHSNVKRSFQRKSTVKNQPRVPRVSTVTEKIPTVDSKFPNAKSTLTADLGDKGKHDSGCSRHMTGNITYLSEYEPYDGGYVSFGHRGGKITGKGIIKTSKLEFENVYFVKELKYNLFSMSQIYDNKNSVLFTDSECLVLGKDFKLNDDTNVFLRTPRQHNMYSIDLNNIVPYKNLTCLVTMASVDESMLWHRRLGHLNFKTMNKLVRNNQVKGLPSKCFKNDHTYVAFLKGKQHKASCKTKFTWNFLTKDETSSILKNFITEIENLKDLKVKIIRCDNGGVFKNQEMNEFCTKKGIRKEFSNARTPQQNRVAERRNRTLIEAAINMLADAKLPVTFWVEAVNTSYHLGKFDAKGDEGYFVGYSLFSKAFRVFNKRTKKVEENLHVDFLENKFIKEGAGPNWLFDIDTQTNSMNYVPVVVAGTSSTNISGTKDVASQAIKKDVSSLRYIALPNWFHKAHMETSNDTIRNSDAQDDSQKEQDYNADVPESSGISNPTATSKFPSADQVEPTVSLIVESKILTVSLPVPTVCLDISPESSSGPRLISKGVFSQKESPSLGNALTLSNRFEYTFGDTTNAITLNEVEADLSNMETSIPISPTPTFRIHKDHPKSQIIGPVDTPVQTRHKNKARLVAQGYTLEEGVDYEEVFAPIARIEAIRLFLAYASFIGFIVYQMDVKSAFLYGTIDEEVYVIQPLGFQDPEFPEIVYKVEKAMYGLHQASRAWAIYRITLMIKDIETVVALGT